MEQYTIKLVTEKPVEIDFLKLHDLIFEDIIKKYPIEDRATWDSIDWINNIGDELSAFAEHYLEIFLQVENRICAPISSAKTTPSQQTRIIAISIFFIFISPLLLYFSYKIKNPNLQQ